MTTHAETVRELRAWAETGFNDSGLVYDARVLALCDSWVALSARLAALEAVAEVASRLCDGAGEVRADLTVTTDVALRELRRVLAGAVDRGEGAA